VRNPFDSHVFERAQKLVDRRRLLLGLGAAVAIALTAAIPGVLTSGGSGKSVKTTASAQAGTTTSIVGDGSVSAELGAPMPTVPPPSSTTTQPPAVLGTSFTQAPTTTTPKAAGKSAPRGPAPTTASTAPACHNSYDPACGQFSWNPPPANDQPEQVTLTPSNTTVKVGDQVGFQVKVSDADNRNFVECAFKWDYGDGAQNDIQTTHCDPKPGADPCPPRYGPWTPPAAQSGNEEFAGIGHAWSTPGTYTVTYTHDSRPNSCYNPYASAGTGTATITVLP